MNCHKFSIVKNVFCIWVLRVCLNLLHYLTGLLKKQFQMKNLRILKLLLSIHCSLLCCSENGWLHMLIRLLVALALSNQIVPPFLSCWFEICGSHCPYPWMISPSFRRPDLKDVDLWKNIDDLIAVPLLSDAHIHRKLRPSSSTHW